MFRSSNASRLGLKSKRFVVTATLLGSGLIASQAMAENKGLDASTAETMLGEYCMGCHDNEGFSGGLSFELLSLSDIHAGSSLDEWERVLHKTRLGEMPPPDKDRPDDAQGRY